MEETVYVLALLLSSGLSLVVATWLWSHDLDDAARIFATMLSLYPLVGLFVVGEIVAADRTVSVAFFALHSTVVAVIVPLWLLFALAYTGRDRWLSGVRLVGFGTVVAAVALLTLTDPLHTLIRSYSLAEEPFTHVAVTETPLFAVLSLYYMLPYLLAIGLLAYHGLVEAPAKRKKVGALLVGFLPILLVVGLWMADAVPGNLDGATNIVSTWTLAFLTWAVFRYQLFDVLSMARKRVFADLNDPIVVLDERYRVIDRNAAAAETFPTLADAEGVHVADCLPGILDDDGDFASEFSHYDEGTREFAVSVSPLSTDAGTHGYGLVLRDVTATHRQIRDLEQQSEQLERFASTLSHDLRNPLNVASGRTELAAETGDLEHLEAAIEAHDRMEQIIEDTLALAREGRTIDDTERVRLVEVFDDAWASTDTREAALTVEPDADVVVAADATRLQNAFENLIRNAVEHGAEREDAADLTITLGDRPGGFYVEDDGTGVPPAERERVFEYEHTTSGSGTGLGLAIVDAIARAHGWSVAMAESDEGGARVVFGDVDVLETTATRQTEPVT